MDDPVADPSVLQEEYRFLARMNRVGGAAERLLSEVESRGLAPVAGPLRLVDFGSGAGDIPARVIGLGRGRGWTVEALGVDRASASIAFARERHGSLAGLTYRELDLFDAPERLGRGRFDVAHASLVLHHLGDRDVVRALRAMAEVATGLVVWNDLIRDRLGVAGAWLSTSLASRSLRADAVTSVRRSFTIDEARAAAEAAGLLEVRVRRVPGGRFVLSGRPGPLPARRPTVRAERLSVAYRARAVLHDLSLVVHAGEALLVEGPNGAGKSTLLGCLAGAILPQGGRVWYDGSSGRVGFHPQDGGLLPAMDVAGNLVTTAAIAGVPRAGRPDAVREAIGRFGLEPYARTPIGRLSGGLRRRVAIAAALVHRPQVVILDEPDAGLDTVGRESLVGVLVETLRRGGTVVLSSHAPEGLTGPLSNVRRMAIGS